MITWAERTPLTTVTLQAPFSSTAPSSKTEVMPNPASRVSRSHLSCRNVAPCAEHGRWQFHVKLHQFMKLHGCRCAERAALAFPNFPSSASASAMMLRCTSCTNASKLSSFAAESDCAVETSGRGAAAGDAGLRVNGSAMRQRGRDSGRLGPRNAAWRLRHLRSGHKN